MEGFIKTTCKFSSMVCWVLPHEKVKIENAVKSLKIEKSVLFIESLSELKRYINNASFVYLSTTKATKYPNKEEIIDLFNDYPQTQFSMGDYDCNCDPLEQNVFLEPLANNFKNVYPRMMLPHTAIEAFSSCEFPDAWADVSPYLKNISYHTEKN